MGQGHSLHCYPTSIMNSDEWSAIVLNRLVGDVLDLRPSQLHLLWAVNGPSTERSTPIMSCYSLLFSFLRGAYSSGLLVVIPIKVVHSVVGEWIFTLKRGRWELYLVTLFIPFNWTEQLQDYKQREHLDHAHNIVHNIVHNNRCEQIFPSSSSPN